MWPGQHLCVLFLTLLTSFDLLNLVHSILEDVALVGFDIETGNVAHVGWQQLSQLLDVATLQLPSSLLQTGGKDIFDNQKWEDSCHVFQGVAIRKWLKKQTNKNKHIWPSFTSLCIGDTECERNYGLEQKFPILKKKLLLYLLALGLIIWSLLLRSYNSGNALFVTLASRNINCNTWHALYNLLCCNITGCVTAYNLKSGLKIKSFGNEQSSLFQTHWSMTDRSQTSLDEQH